MAKLSCAQVILLFRQKVVTSGCKDVIRALEGLGFVVRPGKKGKHHTYTHPKLQGFRAGFDCGHGRDPDVLPVYIMDIVGKLEEHQDALK